MNDAHAVIETSDAGWNMASLTQAYRAQYGTRGNGTGKKEDGTGKKEDDGTGKRE